MSQQRTNAASDGQQGGLIALAIDTSTAGSSLALTKNSREFAALALVDVRQHSQIIFEQLQLLLRVANIRIEEVDLFAAVTGPGSFTGLRIGLAAIQGIAGTLGRPVVGVTGFDALAGDLGLAGHVAALIDAGRGEVFCGLRRVDSAGVPVGAGEDFVGSTESVLEELRRRIPDGTERVYLVGNGALRYAPEICHFAQRAGLQVSCSETIDLRSAGWWLLTRPQSLAGWTAKAATRMVLEGKSPGLRPYYLKPSDAEAKWKSLRGQS